MTTSNTQLVDQLIQAARMREAASRLGYDDVVFAMSHLEKAKAKVLTALQVEGSHDQPTA